MSTRVLGSLIQNMLNVVDLVLDFRKREWLLITPRCEMVVVMGRPLSVMVVVYWLAQTSLW